MKFNKKQNASAIMYLLRRSPFLYFIIPKNNIMHATVVRGKSITPMNLKQKRNVNI